jgi:iron(III) transport system permease protein
MSHLSLKNKIYKSFNIVSVALICLALFFFLILPISTILSKAFFTEEGFSLKYFSLLFQNNLYQDAMKNSLCIGLATTLISILVSLPFAFVNHRYEYKGKSLLSGLFLVPMIMPPFVGAIGVQRFFSRFGTINTLLLDYNIIADPIDWLGDSNLFWAVVALEVFHLYPIMYLNITAAIANIDPSLEDMAKILGASKIKRLLTITIPLITPGIFSGSIIVFIWALTDLGTPLLVGYQASIPVQIFNLVTDINENPLGFALVVSVIIATGGIFLAGKFAIKNERFAMLGKGHSTALSTKASTIQHILIYCLSGALIFLALLPHLGVLLTSISENWFMSPFPENYSLEHYKLLFGQNIAYSSIKNSMTFASIATLVDLVLGAAIAYIVTRKTIAGHSILDAIVMIPLALPGIILAFGYVLTYTDTPLDPLENSIPLLIIAYSIRRLPYMVRSVSAGLAQVHPSLEEASECFGASKLYTIRHITLPLLSANFIAGALLCFSYSMLDVSDSLILAMKDQFYPLTKAIYSFYLEQGNGEYIASALGIIGMIILSTCILGASTILGKRLGELFKGG